MSHAFNNSSAPSSSGTDDYPPDSSKSFALPNSFDGVTFRPAPSDHTSPVLIIGAGLGGLALAQGLLKQNIRFRIFERDPTSHWTAPNYRERINPSTRLCLSQIIPSELCAMITRASATPMLGEAVQFDALTGGVITLLPHADFAATLDNGRAEAPCYPTLIERHTLRQILLRGLDGYIEYGCDFIRYDHTPGGIMAQFKQHHAAKGCFIVGADGAASQFRKTHLPGLYTMDTEGRAIYGRTPYAAINRRAISQAPRVAVDHSCPVPGWPPQANRMSYKSLYMHPMQFPTSRNIPSTVPVQPDAAKQEDHIYWMLHLKKGFSEVVSDANFLGMDGPTAAKLSIALTKHWHIDLCNLMENQIEADTNTLRVCSMPSSIPDWATQPMATVIGDAAHLTSPITQSGTCLAFEDANRLSHILGRGVASIGEVFQYEDNSRRRVERLISVWDRHAYVFSQKPLMY